MIGVGFQVIAILGLLVLVVLCAVMASRQADKARFWVIQGIVLLVIAVVGAFNLDNHIY